MSLSRMTCSHPFLQTEEDAEKVAQWMRDNGGKDVKITGVRGLWAVRANIATSDYAKFCSIESRKKQLA